MQTLVSLSVTGLVLSAGRRQISALATQGDDESRQTVCEERPLWPVAGNWRADETHPRRIL